MTASFVLMLAAALQSGPSRPTRDLDDLDSSYCLETGSCRPPSAGFDRPAPGILFVAIGCIGFGIVLWRSDRARQKEARE